MLMVFRCPTRACPNPDVVKSEDGPAAARKRSNLKRRRKSKTTEEALEENVAATSVVATSEVVESTVMMNRTSSLLRDALLGGPRTAADSNGQRRPQLVQRPRFETLQASSPEGGGGGGGGGQGQGQRQVIVMLTPTYSTLPTSIALPQTPVPLSQLTTTTTSTSVHDGGTLRSVSSSMTPSSSSSGSSSSSSSLGTTTSRDDDIIDDLMNIDDSMLFEMMDPKRLGSATEVTTAVTVAASTAVDTKPALTLPLLDQSDDPYLNEGDESLSFVTDELDETVQKWMETCEGNFLPI